MIVDHLGCTEKGFELNCEPNLSHFGSSKIPKILENVPFSARRLFKGS